MSAGDLYLLGRSCYLVLRISPGNRRGFRAAKTGVGMRTRPLVAAIIVALAASSLAARSLADESTLTPAQREEVAKLLGAFRQNKSTPKNRPGIVEKLVKFGTPAVRQLSEVIDAELHTAMEPYREAFRKQAQAVLHKQAGGLKPETIRQLQIKVLALRDRDGLTQETITREADPAMKQLAAAGLVDVEKVLQ